MRGINPLVIRRLLRSHDALAVAHSGGVHSSVVLSLAVTELGPERVVAVTALSDAASQEAASSARTGAAALGVAHRLVIVPEPDADLVGTGEEPESRCRQALRAALAEEAGRAGVWVIVDGVHADDVAEGRSEADLSDRELFLHPLAEAGLGREAVRTLARELGLSPVTKPAPVCLSSRFFPGEEPTPADMHRVQVAEDLLRELGFSAVRVRHHQRVARIEVPLEELEWLVHATNRTAVIRRFKDMGWERVTVDIEGLGGSVERMGTPAKGLVA